MIAGARIAVGRGAARTHRQLCRELDPLSRLGYVLSLVYAISLPTHDRRANAIANAIVLGGALLTGEMIYEAA
jgi:hypothetical protein